MDREEISALAMTRVIGFVMINVRKQKILKMINEDLTLSVIQTFLDDPSFLACGALIIPFIVKYDCSN